MPATRGPARHSSANSARITEHLARRYGPHEPEHREAKEAPDQRSAALTYDDMVAGFAADPEFQAMVEDEARVAMFSGRGGRLPLPRRA